MFCDLCLVDYMKLTYSSVSFWGFPWWIISKEFPCIAGDTDLISGLWRTAGEGNGNPLQYSCWRISWTEEPGGLQSMGSQRVGHKWAYNKLIPLAEPLFSDMFECARLWETFKAVPNSYTDRITELDTT